MHIPVMLAEVMDALALKSGDTVVDCTLGGGGYTKAMAEVVGSDGQVIAIDADEEAIKNLEFRIKNLLPNNIVLVHDNFRNLKEILKTHELQKVDGVVFDLGLSSDQLRDASRGFSFALDAPLVMEMGELRNKQSATYTIVNITDRVALENIIRTYGEERYAGRIARAITAHRPLQTTKQLAAVITNAVPAGYEHGRLHPATRTFQALRIATNDELNSLREGLAAAVDVLQPGGRVVVVSFHSLEDRIVKQLFKRESSGCVCPAAVPVCVCEHVPQLRVITKKIVTPTAAEVAGNPRSRSAKLRAAEKIS